MSLDIAILAYVILPTSSVHVITEPNTLQLAWYIRGPFFAPFIDVLRDLLWFLGDNFEGYTTEDDRCWCIKNNVISNYKDIILKNKKLA